MPLWGEWRRGVLGARSTRDLSCSWRESVTKGPVFSSVRRGWMALVRKARNLLEDFSAAHSGLPGSRGGAFSSKETTYPCAFSLGPIAWIFSTYYQPSPPPVIGTWSGMKLRLVCTAGSGHSWVSRSVSCCQDARILPSPLHPTPLQMMAGCWGFVLSPNPGSPSRLCLLQPR